MIREVLKLSNGINPFQIKKFLYDWAISNGPLPTEALALNSEISPTVFSVLLKLKSEKVYGTFC